MKPSYTQHYVGFPDLLFEHLLKLDWLNVTEARREYFMSDIPRSYNYGKAGFEREYNSNLYTPHVKEVLNTLNLGGMAYNVCFLNRYDHQRQHLGWHADDSPTMDRLHPISVISLGAEREIWWRLNDQKGIVPEENRQLLHFGSLFVMPAGFQDTHQHRIPKCDKACGTRISLTFRRYA